MTNDQSSTNRINGDRLWGRMEALAEITDPARPYMRRSFTDLHLRGRAQLRDWFTEAGLSVSLDAAANLIGRRKRSEPSLPPIMIGSHSDTVADGGRFDGIAGVLAGLEVANSLADQGIDLRHPLEVVDFLAEEPSEYGMSCVGSRLMGGRLSRADLAITEPGGETLEAAIERMGGNPAALDSIVRRPGSVAAYVELHIEQGRVLESRGLDVGVVTGIVGITRYNLILEGRADHAGSTPMDLRRDALTAASRFVLLVEETAQGLNDTDTYFVATVGRLAVEPDAANVVPGRVELCVEYRTGSEEAQRKFLSVITDFADGVERETGIAATLERLSDADPVRCADSVRTAIKDACGMTGYSYTDIASGAGHDAMHVAAAGPMGMIFIPCRNGRSHCPEEWVEPGQLAAGTEVLLQTVLELDSRLG
ncbi:MAG: Zn-dependent hydrolase [Rhodospirillales bacterium]|nr:Zn-dependent hydrolase [Rhodospirillales bacterium]